MQNGLVPEIQLSESEVKRLAKFADSEDFQFFKEIVEGRILQARAYATMAFEPEKAETVHGEFVLWREISELCEMAQNKRNKESI